MVRRKGEATRERLLTDVELEIMGILWRIGQGSVHDIQAALPRHRELAYTSVSTMVRILEQKGFVSSRKEGRGHVYLPAVEKQEYEAKSVQNLVSKVFDGAPGSLVRRLVQDGELSEEELRSIRELLDRKLGGPA